MNATDLDWARANQDNSDRVVSAHACALLEAAGTRARALEETIVDARCAEEMRYHQQVLEIRKENAIAVSVYRNARRDHRKRQGELRELRLLYGHVRRKFEHLV